MATKVLSMEIGQGLTRVVEMDYMAKNPKVYNCFSFETPQDVIQDGVVNRNDTFTAVLNAELQKRGIRTNSVVFSVTSARIATREIRIPQVKEKKIQETIMANASDYFPVDLTQYHLIPGTPEKDDTEGKQWKLNLMAVPNELTNSYLDFADACGLNLVAIDYVGNSIYSVVKDTLITGTNVVLKVDERTTLITILKDGSVEFQRIINNGIEDAVNVVRDSNTFGANLTYGEAVQVLCGKTCIRRYLNMDDDYKEEEDTSKDIAETRADITDSLRYLIAGVSRVLEYYLSANDGESFDSVALVGLGADFSGLSKLLTNELNHPVRVFTNLQNTNMGRTLDDAYMSVATYAACIGACIGTVNLIPESQMKTKGKKGGKKSGAIRETAVTVGVSLLVLGVVGGAVLSGISLTKYMGAKNEKTQIENHIEQLRAEGVEEVYQQYTTVGSLNSQLNQVYGLTMSRNEDLVAFIEELEDKMPSSLVVLNFTATSTGVTMTAECKDKEAAAKTLMQLRTFDSIEIVESSGLTDSASLLGGAADSEAVVTFTVDCVYKPIVTEEPVDVAAEQPVEEETEAE